MIIKNNASGSLEELKPEHGITILITRQELKSSDKLHYPVEKSHIQFHFCLSGNAAFWYNDGRYSLQVRAEQSLLLYNTRTDLPIEVELTKDSLLVSVIISIRKFHSLFSDEADFITFLDPDFSEKKYYSQEQIIPSIAAVLGQIVNCTMHPLSRSLYMKGKVYELMSLYFDRTDEVTFEQCPYLQDEDHLQRIRQAKEILISRMIEPPSLASLASEIGLPLKKLKTGFKEVYGTSVYGFLLDYKMDYARKLLETGRYKVNDIALRVGYSTSSHFISAFKKRYRTTPKQYLLSL